MSSHVLLFNMDRSCEGHYTPVNLKCAIAGWAAHLVTGDWDKLLEALIAKADRVVKLESATLSLEKPVPAPVTSLNTSSPKGLDRLSGLEYAS